MKISYTEMIKQKPLHFFDKIRLCPDCGEDITANNITEEYDTIAICPKCGLKIYLGGS